MSLKLSNHFFLHEFARSETAARMGRTINIPDRIVPSLKALCVNVLEPLRVDLDKPIFVLSGYRPPWLNRAVGGSEKSQHMLGEAADFVVTGMKPIDVCRRIVALRLPFDQVILEFDQWVHVSYSVKTQRGSVLTARKKAGKTVYLQGIVAKT